MINSYFTTISDDTVSCMFDLQRVSSGTACRWRAGSSCSAPCQLCSQTADLTWGIKPRSCADTSRANPEYSHTDRAQPVQNTLLQILIRSHNLLFDTHYFAIFTNLLIISLLILITCGFRSWLCAEWSTVVEDKLLFWVCFIWFISMDR